jgi:hypothetical protein
MRPMLCALVTRPPLPASPLLLRSAACAALAPGGSPARCAASAACPGPEVLRPPSRPCPLPPPPFRAPPHDGDKHQRNEITPPPPPPMQQRPHDPEPIIFLGKNRRGIGGSPSTRQGSPPQWNSAMGPHHVDGAPLAHEHAQRARARHRRVQHVAVEQEPVLAADRHDHHRVLGALRPPRRRLQSIFRDKNRRDSGKSQSTPYHPGRRRRRRHPPEPCGS